MTVIIFVLSFSVLVLVHEWGHFITARLLGIPVEEFGVGFPPRLFSKKRGSTIFSINAIPLGGFVRLTGESEDTPDNPNGFGRQSILRRALVIVSGVAMNALLAYVLLVVLLIAGVPQELSNLPAGSRVRDPRVQVVGVLEGSPAQRAGVVQGERILSVDHKTITSIEELQSIVRAHPDTPLAILTRSQENEQDVERMITPTTLHVGTKTSVGIGVELVSMGTVSYSAGKAVVGGAYILAQQTRFIFQSLWGLLRDLVLVQRLPADVAGPIGIAVLVGEASRSGWQSFLSLLSMLSLNLAVLNVLPIPALDGGRLAFLGVEAIVRRPVHVRVETVIHYVGFLLLLTLILLISIHDIRTIFF